MRLFAVSSQWLAQTVASSSHQQITIRDATHGRLQCTLRTSGKPGTQQPSSGAMMMMHRLTLHGHVLVGEAAGNDDNDDAAGATAMVWDLNRGVMAFQVTGTVRSACCRCDGAAAVDGAMTSQKNIYVLKQKEHTDKLIVYEYNGDSGTVVRKVKAGRTMVGQQQQLFVTHDLLVVVQSDDAASVGGNMSWRMTDLTIGSKRAKANTGAVRQIVVVTTNNSISLAFGILASSTLFCLHLATGRVVELPANLAKHDIREFQVVAKPSGGGFYLLVNNAMLYRLDHDDDDDDDSSMTITTATLHCTFPTTNDRNSVVYILHADRLLVVDGHDGTVRRVYMDLETLPNELLAPTNDDDDDAVMNDDDANDIEPAVAVKNKRKSGNSSSGNDTVAVLGPGQAGGACKADVEHAATPATKRTKKSSVNVVSDSSSATTLHHDDTTMEEEEQELTIAERLRQLEQAADELESSEEDAERPHRDGTTVAAAAVVGITTESLYQLVAQSLQSGDRQLLETALRVADPAVIRGTCRELDVDQTRRLLYGLTDRMAARPGRGERLAAWLAALVPTVATADDLKPLHNLIQDRLQVYPRLMQLQGRLQYLENSDEGQ